MPPSFLELGLAELLSIYNKLCELGSPPPVIDAADLQEDPEVKELPALWILLIKHPCIMMFNAYAMDV